ncbi:MAG: ArdC-like ssDNA-binding domain-containing protein [Planctomycetota bacterium]
MQAVQETRVPTAGTGSEKVKELRRRIDESVDTLAKVVDEVRASETFQSFLKIQARFHQYSWCNSLLILSQKPDAIRVAGYRTWQSLGRQVRKGEHGIMIFAPCPWKRERETDSGETEIEKGIFFRAVHVFDIGQTDGPDLPCIEVPDVEATADALLADLVRVTAQRKIAVAFQPISSGAYGLSKNGSIEVDNRHATGQQAKTLCHELAHEALHWEDRGPLTRSIAELEAESVAYVVCHHFGLDVEVRASRYIALWQGDGKSLRSSLERIANTARELIDDLEVVRSGKAVS